MMMIGKTISIGKIEFAKAREDKVRPCITCPLCKQPYDVPTTIPECLHTFCKKCIHEKIESENRNSCPVCNAYMGNAPLDKLRVDNKWQNIMTSLFVAENGKKSKEIHPIQAIKVKPPEKVQCKRKEKSLSSLADSFPKNATQNITTKKRSNLGNRRKVIPLQVPFGSSIEPNISVEQSCSPKATSSKQPSKKPSEKKSSRKNKSSKQGKSDEGQVVKPLALLCDLNQLPTIEEEEEPNNSMSTTIIEQSNIEMPLLNKEENSEPKSKGKAITKVYVTSKSSKQDTKNNVEEEITQALATKVVLNIKAPELPTLEDTSSKSKSVDANSSCLPEKAPATHTNKDETTPDQKGKGKEIIMIDDDDDESNENDSDSKQKGKEKMEEYREEEDHVSLPLKSVVKKNKKRRQKKHVKKPQPVVQPQGKQSEPVVQPQGSHPPPVVQPQGKQSEPVVHPQGKQSEPVVHPQGSHPQSVVQPQGKQSEPVVQPQVSLPQPVVQPQGNPSRQVVQPQGNHPQPVVQQPQSVPPNNNVTINITITRPHGVMNMNEVWFSLVAADYKEGYAPLEQIEQKYLRVKDPEVPVSAIKKYIAKKLNLGGDFEVVELMILGDPVIPSLKLRNLLDIWRQTAPLRSRQIRARVGSSAEDCVMTLTYAKKVVIT